MKKTLLLIATFFVAALGSFAQDIPEYVPAEGLIGWWPFSGDANDLSGNANNGTIIGDVVLTTDRFGNEASAYDFPGNLESYISVENNAGFENLTQGISFSAWYLTDATDGDRRVFQIGNTDGGGKGLMLMLLQGEPWVARVHSGFTVTNAGRIGGWPTQAQSVKGVWTHVAFTANFTTGQWRLYQNGIQQGQGTTNNPIGYNPLSLAELAFNIGLKAPSGFFPNDAWLGKIDDLGIWGRVLNQCEILDLYGAELDYLQVDAGELVEVCPDGEVVLLATSNLSENSIISWSDGITDGEPFTVNEPGTYFATATVGTCAVSDSVFIDLLEPTFGVDTLTACEEFTWIDGITYTESNDTALFVLTNAAGCDSTVTLNLTVFQPDTVTQIVKSCDTFTWIDGNTYTSDIDTVSVVLTNIYGCDSVVTLALSIDTLQILTQPVDQIGFLTGGVEFSLLTTASDPLYQWQTDLGAGFEDLGAGGQYAGVEAQNLAVSNLSFDNDFQLFRCIIIEEACVDTTDVALLNVCGTITLQPEDQVALEGEQATFTVASSDLTASYQWQSNIGFGFQNLSDAGQYSGTTTPTLTVSDVTPTNNNQLFRCVVSSGVCEFDSDDAVLIFDDGVNVANLAHLPFRAYPNPADAWIMIDAGSDFVGEQWMLYDLNGRMLGTGLLTAAQTRIDLTAFARGMYVLTVGAELRHSMRVVKQ